MKWETENTKELILLSQAGDKAAREQLINENAPLVKSIVKRYLGRGVEYDDLYQIGNMGLLKAISGFNTQFDVRFSTYAVPMIHGEIKRFIRDNNPVKMPRSLKEMQQKIRYCHQQLCLKLGREPGTLEIAQELNCELEEVLFALESMNTCASLDEPSYEDGGATTMDLLEDKSERAAIWDRLALRQCLEQLEERERQIILLRYYKNYTQARIAQLMGISQVQISRIESRTLEKLRKKMK